MPVSDLLVSLVPSRRPSDSWGDPVPPLGGGGRGGGGGGRRRLAGRPQLAAQHVPLTTQHWTCVALGRSSQSNNPEHPGHWSPCDLTGCVGPGSASRAETKTKTSHWTLKDQVFLNCFRYGTNQGHYSYFLHPSSAKSEIPDVVTLNAPAG